MKSVLVIPGDGIGPEVIAAARGVIGAVVPDLEYTEADVGVYRKHRTPITADTLQQARDADAILFGATETPAPRPNGYPSPIVELRKNLDLFANVRPARSYGGVPSVHEGVDLVLVRENTEGLYSGNEHGTATWAEATRRITQFASERVCRHVFELAEREERRTVTAVHKANILPQTDGIFLDAFYYVARQFPAIENRHMLVDAAGMNLAMRPQKFDVIVTTNMFGDILSDVAAGVTGGLGIAPSGSYGAKYALFEPVHGSAPDIAGKGIANPTAAILSGSMMLDYLGYGTEAQKVQRAVEQVLAEGKVLTPDLKGTAGTDDVAREIMQILGKEEVVVNG